MKASQLLWYSIIIILSFIPLFFKLGDPAIFIWDEAIYANNAMEMAENGRLLTPTNNGEISTYNIKPPLVIWLQALSIKLFGLSEWAIRLPSALAALACVLLIFSFLRKYVHPFAGIAAVLFLITTPGYIRLHISRTGDLDSVLVFFICFYTLSLFDFLLSNGPNKELRYALLISLGLIGGFLTKSIAAFLALPGLLLGIFLIRRVDLFRQKWVYLSALSVAITTMAYYFFREQLQSGYTDLVWKTEIARYGVNVMPWHQEDFWFYLQNMKEKFNPIYLWALPIGILGLLSKEKTIKQLTILCWSFCLSYFMIISLSTIKLQWYDAPLYPFLSILLGIGLWECFQFVRKAINVNPGYQWAFTVLLILMFSIPYYKIYQQHTSVLPVDPLEWEGYAIRELSRSHPGWKNYSVFMEVKHSPHLDQANFYIKKLNKKGYHLQLIRDHQLVQKGDTILLAQPQSERVINEHFETSLIESIHQASLLSIIDKK